MSEDHRVIKKLREDAASNPLAWLFAHDALELLVYVDRLRAENQRLREENERLNQALRYNSRYGPGGE